MGRISYGMITSLDGYVNGPDRTFDWAEPDEETHRFVNERERGVGTYLYGRRMFATMRAWAEDDWLVGQPAFVQDYARLWREAEKVVFSSTLDPPKTPRTRLEQRLDLDTVQALKDASAADLSVSGPNLAGPLLRAGLVDELAFYVVPIVVGGGTRFLPAQLQLALSLVEERRFSSGTLFLRYTIGPPTPAT